ncbi:hypothetical protein ACSBR2_004231 [Camellia fascicularis]
MDAITNKVAANMEALTKLQRLSRVSTSHPFLVAHLVLKPPLPAEELPEPNLQEDLRVLAQPMEGLFPTDIDGVDPTTLKLAKLEKMFEKSERINSIPDIEDGFTDIIMRLPEHFKMPHMDRFDGAGDPMVHIHLFSDILKPVGLSRAQKLSLFRKTMLEVTAIWCAKLEDSANRVGKN